MLTAHYLQLLCICPLFLVLCCATKTTMPISYAMAKNYTVIKPAKPLKAASSYSPHHAAHAPMPCTCDIVAGLQV